MENEKKKEKEPILPYYYIRSFKFLYTAYAVLNIIIYYMSFNF
jgi:hypothetical protein